MKILNLLLLLVIGVALVHAEGPVISDDVIYDQVRVKLAGDRETGGDNIQVKVTQGVVELSGTVRNPGSKSKAEKLAKKVKGVKKVESQLKVATP